MGAQKKCVYYGLRLPSGKLYVYADWLDAWARPANLPHPSRYSKTWNWGVQAGKEAYDLAYALIVHTFRAVPGKEIVAQRYAIPFAEKVLSTLPTDVSPLEQPPAPGGNPPLWSLTQDYVHTWIDNYEQSIRDEADLRAALLGKGGW